MTALFNRCLRNFINVCSPKCAIIRHKSIVLNPRLNNYFENLGLTQSEIQMLVKRNRRLLQTSPENVDDLLKLMESHNVDNHTVITNYSKILYRKSSAIREYVRVLEECGFEEIKPEYLIHYFRIMKYKYIHELKSHSYLPENLDVYDKLCKCFKLWTSEVYATDKCNDENITLFALRLKVLEKYLKWRLSVNKDRFDKIIKTYSAFYHKALQDMEESINIAERELKMTHDRIVRNPFVISADPVNTMKIINEVKELNGIDAREALCHFTLLIKEDYRHLIEVNRVIKRSNLSPDCKLRTLILYVYKPNQLVKRLNDIANLPEVRVFITNQRLPYLVQFKKNLTKRIETIKHNNIKCLSIQYLTCANKVFQRKLQNFGDKNVVDDVLETIRGNLKYTNVYDRKVLKKYLSRHSFYLNVPLVRIADNIKFLSETFSHNDIMKNCHILLYPKSTIELYLPLLLKWKSMDREHQKNYLLQRNMSKLFIKSYSKNDNIDIDETDEEESCGERRHDDLEKTLLRELNKIDFDALNNNQMLGLLLYLIESKCSFTCDGIWELTES